MNETTEDYVSFEVAKLLKEKGFNYPCRVVYSPKGSVKHYLKEEVWAHHLKGHKKLCPTLQMAMAWIRGTYNIHIAIVPCEVSPGVIDYTYVLYKVDPKNWSFKNLEIQGRADTDKMSVPETCDAGIKYFLENLEDLI